jgi:NAD(P)-dependent dehydrogenase (short-subunit alcohol dehydrogenase family)
MRVLVTGGSSALAQAIALQLHAAGHVVRLTDRPGAVRLQSTLSELDME